MVIYQNHRRRRAYCTTMRMMTFLIRIRTINTSTRPSQTIRMHHRSWHQNLRVIKTSFSSWRSVWRKSQHLIARSTVSCHQIPLFQSPLIYSCSSSVNSSKSAKVLSLRKYCPWRTSKSYRDKRTSRSSFLGFLFQSNLTFSPTILTSM